LPRGEEYLKGRIKEGVKFDSQIDLKVGEMSESAMDEYMKFCGKVLGGTKGVEGWIVMEELKGDEEEEEEEEEEAIVVGNGIELTDDEKRLPGSCYNILNGRDVCGILCEEYERLLVAGAKVVGVPVEYLGVVMESYERRI